MNVKLTWTDRNADETLKLRKQWSEASLIRRATDVWDLVGDLEAAT